MRFSKFAATSALCIAAVGISAGTAYAAPATPAPAVAKADNQQAGIHWTADRVGDSVVVKTDLGSLVRKDDQLQVVDPSGQVLTGVPLAYDLNGKQFPIAAQVDGNTATLTPSTDAAAAKPVDMVKPVDATFDSNLSRLSTQFGLATGVGTLVGTIVGLTGGCVLGALVGAALMTPIFVPGWVGSCIAGAAAGAALGAAAGTILLGVPVGIASAIQFFQLQNAPAPAN